MGTRNENKTTATSPSFRLETSGVLLLKENPRLEDLEAFCTEARRLGLSGVASLQQTRQGLMGPVVAWGFRIPVVPKKLKEAADGNE